MKNEGDVLGAIYKIARKSGYRIFRFERVCTGAPDVILETDNGMILVELKYAKGPGKPLFSVIQAHLMSSLNTRGERARALGLIYILVDEIPFYVVDCGQFSTHSTPYIVGETSFARRFTSLEKAFDYIVQNY